ncbi:HEAT repeat domain-containing protein [Nitrolancea hollandica]|nr:HEAT repeat domain-containing protein [Nitrolancea hollandica]
MQYLFRLSQRLKPEISVEQYAPIYRAAFEEIDSAPAPPDFNDPFFLAADQNEFVGFFQQQAAYWERVNARRLELEALRPDHRLSRLHEETVKYLRGTLRVMNILAESTIAVSQGDLSTARQKEAEAESWAPVLTNVARKLSNALRQIQDEQPTLFSMLGLPSSLLNEFGVEIEDSFSYKRDVDQILFQVTELEVDDPDAVLESAIQDLVDLGEAAIPHLQTALRNPHEGVRGVVSMALGRMGSPGALVLLDASRDSDENVRLAATLGLALVGEMGMQRLYAMLGDQALDVRLAAANCLARLEGRLD